MVRFWLIAELINGLRKGLLLGEEIAPERRDEVREIWKYLTSSVDHVEQAIDYLRDVEQKTSEMTGMPSEGMFGIIDRSQWIENCQFVPAAFAKELDRS